MLLTIATIYLLWVVLSYQGWRLLFPVRTAYLLAILTGLLLWVPINSLPVYAYIVGVTSYLSVSSFVLLLACCMRQWNGNAAHSLLHVSLCQQRFTYRILAYSGLILYPMTLGLTQFDPYVLGYWHSFPGYFYVVVSLLAVMTILSCRYRYYHLPLIFTLSLLAYAMQISPSMNWWDYYIDPWIWCYAVYFLVRNLRNVRLAEKQ